MWSDSPPGIQQVRRTWVDLGLVPPRASEEPSPAPQALMLPLRVDATPERVARSAHHLVDAGHGPGAVRPTSVWLDGGEDGRHLIAVRVAAALRGVGGRSRLQAGSRDCRLDVDPLVALDGTLEHLAAMGAESGPRLFGSLGYDLGARLEQMPSLPPADLPLPDLEFMVCDVWLEGSRDDAGKAPRWRLHSDRAWCSPRQLEAIARSLSEGLRDGAEAAAGASSTGTFRVISQPDAAEYRAAVARTVERIHAGDLFETNICRRLEARGCGPPWPLYRCLRAASPAEYGAYLESSRGAVLSVSPELFLRVRDGHVQTRPIKGTRPRGKDDSDDAQLLEELLASDKDAAELAMIVDLARNDLGRVCVPGSVRVAAHRRVMSLATVHHTVSVVEGELPAGTGPVRLVRATFPPASITGAPKIEAMRVAYAEEPCRRGVAMGSIGWIDPSGDLELSVAIRTAVMAEGCVAYHAGGGIVADSDPDRELAETDAKARPFLAALRQVGDGG